MEKSLAESDLAGSKGELQEMTPPPMTQAITKEPKEAAIQKHVARKRLLTKAVSPTGSPSTVKKLIILHFLLYSYYILLRSIVRSEGQMFHNSQIHFLCP